jgi:hypothetical protein
MINLVGEEGQHYHLGDYLRLEEFFRKTVLGGRGWGCLSQTPMRLPSQACWIDFTIDTPIKPNQVPSTRRGLFALQIGPKRMAIWVANYMDHIKEWRLSFRNYLLPCLTLSGYGFDKSGQLLDFQIPSIPNYEDGLFSALWDFESADDGRDIGTMIKGLAVLTYIKDHNPDPSECTLLQPASPVDGCFRFHEFVFGRPESTSTLGAGAGFQKKEGL